MSACTRSTVSARISDCDAAGRRQSAKLLFSLYFADVELSAGSDLTPATVPIEAGQDSETKPDTLLVFRDGRRQSTRRVVVPLKTPRACFVGAT
jgi:hypothetical protein